MIKVHEVYQLFVCQPLAETITCYSTNTLDPAVGKVQPCLHLTRLKITTFNKYSYQFIVFYMFKQKVSSNRELAWKELLTPSGPLGTQLGASLGRHTSAYQHGAILGR